MKADDPWLILAERIDSLRLVPRALLFGYCGFTAFVIKYLLVWYTHLPAAQETLQNAGLFTAVGTVLTGFGVPIFSIYSQNGRDWNASQAVTTETVVSSKTVTP